MTTPALQADALEWAESRVRELEADVRDMKYRYLLEQRKAEGFRDQLAEMQKAEEHRRANEPFAIAWAVAKRDEKSNRMAMQLIVSPREWCALSGYGRTMYLKDACEELERRITELANAGGAA